MHLQCSFCAELFREEYYQYFHEFDIAVKEHDEVGKEHLVGRVLIDKLFWQTAQIDGEPLAEICDDDSEGWYEVHQAITSPDDPQELSDDLRVAEGVSEVLFVHRVLLHPDISDRVAVLDAIFRAVTDEDAIIVMLHDAPQNTTFTEQEYAALGFAKFAGTDLIYRDCHLLTAFGKANPRGKDVGLAATEEHEKWVHAEWERAGR